LSKKATIFMALHCNTRCQRYDGESGFTLIELIIVCSLMGLLLSLTIPTLRNNLVTNQLDTSARKIIGTVKELRNMAVRDHKPYLLHFDLDSQNYWYEADGTVNPLNEEPETISEIPEGVTLRDVHAHSQGQQNSGRVTLWISSKGYMDQTVLHLSDDEGQVLSLFFSPFSGAARVYREDLEAEG